MPELPDVEMYLTRIGERVIGSTLQNARAYNPFVLRTVTPSLADLSARKALRIERIGKRIVLGLEDDQFVVIHLMISGRFTWRESERTAGKPMGKILLAEFTFDSGVLGLQEMSTRKRASIHLVSGRDNLAQFHRGGLDTLTATPEAFHERLQVQNRTLKRALADPTLFDAIGNAYSDEILFAARLSPVKLTRSLSHEESQRLHHACQEILSGWRDKLLVLYPGFPKPADVTAFRPEFATHGKFGKPCPVCASPIQHIVYAENETNYCARCQNEGRLLADRSLSRLLKSDWPKTLEEMAGE